MFWGNQEGEQTHIDMIRHRPHIDIEVDVIGTVLLYSYAPFYVKKMRFNLRVDYGNIDLGALKKENMEILFSFSIYGVTMLN